MGSEERSFPAGSCGKTIRREVLEPGLDKVSLTTGCHKELGAQRGVGGVIMSVLGLEWTCDAVAVSPCTWSSSSVHYNGMVPPARTAPCFHTDRVQGGWNTIMRGKCPGVHGVLESRFPTWGPLWHLHNVLRVGGIRRHRIWWQPPAQAEGKERKLSCWCKVVWPKCEPRQPRNNPISLRNNPIRRDQRKDQQLKHVISHLSIWGRRPTERLRHLGRAWEVFLQLELH